MKKLFAIATAAAMLAACENGGGDEGNDIHLPDDTPREYTVYADDTSGTPNEGISFTSAGPWTATIEQTRADAPDWISVSPDHGDTAGEYTIRIALKRNDTGSDRTAAIVIAGGDSRITITVEQKGTTESGDEPVESTPVMLVSGMHFYFPQNPDSENQRSQLEYDNYNNLVKWTQTDTEYDGSQTVETITYTYGYENRNEVLITSDLYDDYIIAYLDDAGRAVRAEEVDGDGRTDVTEYSYDDSGRLISTRQEGEWETYVWENGNITEIRYGNDDGESNATAYTYYEDMDNMENFDILIDRTSWLEELSVAGLLGQQSRNLVHTETGDYESADKDNGEWKYTLDEYGYVTKAAFYQPDSGHDDNPRTAEFTHVQAR